MDIEILQKYKAGGSGEYMLVYKSGDDPFEDILIQNAEELTGEIAINLTGEVTMAATVGDKLDQILDSYGGEETPVTVSAYTNSSNIYTLQTEPFVEAPEEEQEEAVQKPQADLGYECSVCSKIFKYPGICEDCKIVLTPVAE